MEIVCLSGKLFLFYLPNKDMKYQYRVIVEVSTGDTEAVKRAMDKAVSDHLTAWGVFTQSPERLVKSRVRKLTIK